MFKEKIIDFRHIKGDMFGGVTAGMIALPLALAFGVQSGLGATAGLYGAMALGIFAALFGGTNTQIRGPTGPMTVISALVISTADETHAVAAFRDKIFIKHLYGPMFFGFTARFRELIEVRQAKVAYGM